MRGTRIAAESDEWPACHRRIHETGHMGSMYSGETQLLMHELKRLTRIPSGEGLGGCKTKSVLCHEQKLTCKSRPNSQSPINNAACQLVRRQQ